MLLIIVYSVIVIVCGLWTAVVFPILGFPCNILCTLSLYSAFPVFCGCVFSRLGCGQALLCDTILHLETFDSASDNYLDGLIPVKLRHMLLVKHCPRCLLFCPVLPLGHNILLWCVFGREFSPNIFLLRITWELVGKVILPVIEP